MTLNRAFSSALALSTLTAAMAFGAPALIAPPTGTIGSNLEAFTTIRLTDQAPADGLTITLTSDDPARLLFATAPDEAGSKTLTLTVPPRHGQSPEFYLQAFGPAGTATYTASAPGSDSIKGTVQIANSAVLIGGPSKALAFRTVIGTPVKITAYTAVLDASGNVIDQQPVAGGHPVNVAIASSDAQVGSLLQSPLVLVPGTTKTATHFNPLTPGAVTITAAAPVGFEAIAKPIAVTVNLPGLALMGDINLGKNLEVLGYVLLGQNAPEGGLDVTLTSPDPAKLVLSTGEDVPGSQTITLHIAAGEGKAPYYLQALSDSGVVYYTGTAKGYRSKPTAVTLAPSGVMVVFAPYGPPDEGEFLKPMPTPNARPLYASLSDHKPLFLSIWSVYLDPATHRGADITAQRLRPGLALKVDLKNSNPEVAKIASSVTLSSKSLCGFAEFQPLKPGDTVVSINTPPDFNTPSNATSVTATVRE